MLQVPAQREGAAAWTQARKPLRGGPGPRPYPQPSAARPGPGGLVRGPVEIIIVAVIMCGHVPHAGQLVSAAPRPSVHILSNAPCSSLQVRLRDAQGSAKATQLGPEARVCAYRSPPAWAKPMARGEDKVPPRCRFKKKNAPQDSRDWQIPGPLPPRKRGSPARPHPAAAAAGEKTWLPGCLLLSHKQEGRKEAPLGRPLRDPLSSSFSSPHLRTRRQAE